MYSRTRVVKVNVVKMEFSISYNGRHLYSFPHRKVDSWNGLDNVWLKCSQWKNLKRNWANVHMETGGKGTWLAAMASIGLNPTSGWLTLGFFCWQVRQLLSPLTREISVWCVRLQSHLKISDNELWAYIKRVMSNDCSLACDKALVNTHTLCVYLCVFTTR